MVRVVLLDSNQHEIKWWCDSETTAEVYICKIHSELDKTSHHFSWYGENTRIHEIITLVCDTYHIYSSSKKLDDRVQEWYFMIYTNIRATIKWWDPHTKKLKYCSSETFDENNNKLGKGWSPGSEIMTSKNISTLPT